MDRHEWRDRYAMEDGHMVVTAAMIQGQLPSTNRPKPWRATSRPLHWGRLALTLGCATSALGCLDFGDDGTGR